jgi:hypothetical protein
MRASRQGLLAHHATSDHDERVVGNPLPTQTKAAHPGVTNRSTTFAGSIPNPSPSQPARRSCPP